MVEGLEGGRFAVINKLHHCMIDGSSGADLATVMFSLTPEHEPPTVRAYVPRPAPSSAELLRDHWLRRLSLPVVLAEGLRVIGEARSAGELSLRTEISKRAQALGELMGYAVSGASDTPIPVEPPVVETSDAISETPPPTANAAATMCHTRRGLPHMTRPFAWAKR